MEVIEHFAEISLVSRVLGGERVLPRQEVSRVLSLRRKAFDLQGPPGGDECPVPAESAFNLPGERILLTREELESLIRDAVRELGGTGTA